jgi:DNA-binding NarL/FixJ family response regulator
VHILLFDAACIPEWPELVSKWTSAGYKAILLVAEGWGSGGAAHRALHLGVSGIVHVAIEFHTQIVDAIALVASGQLCVKDTVNDRQATSRRKNCSSSEPHISFREEQVIDLVILGFSNTKIGIQLGISESTAKFHVCNVLHKLGLKRRGELRGRTVCAFDMYKERLAAQIKDQRIIKGT